MVCDVAVASTVVSLMMNGVCCMWQQQEEKEMRAAIRRDVRTEYWNQRMMDHELVDQRYTVERRIAAVSKGVPCLSSVSHQSSSSAVQEERRKKLQLDKIEASGKTWKENKKKSLSNDPTAALVSPQTSPGSGSIYFHSSYRRRAHASPVAKPSWDARLNKKVKTIGIFGQTTSLVDSNSEDDDADCASPSTSFTDVCLD